MVYIKKNKNKHFPYKNIKWVVVNTKYKTRDYCLDFKTAIQYFLWNLGLPARLVFKSYHIK